MKQGILQNRYHYCQFLDVFIGFEFLLHSISVVVLSSSESPTPGIQCLCALITWWCMVMPMSCMSDVLMGSSTSLHLSYPYFIIKGYRPCRRPPKGGAKVKTGVLLDGVLAFGFVAAVYHLYDCYSPYISVSASPQLRRHQKITKASQWCEKTGQGRPPGSNAR